MLCKFKNSRYWYVRFTAPSGKRICCSTRTENRKLAQEFEVRLKEREWRKHYTGHVDHSWEDAVITYSQGKEVSAWHLRILHKYCAGRLLKDLGDVRDRVVNDRLADGVSNATVNRTLEVFRAVMNAAARRGWCKAPYVEMLPEPKGRVRWLTHEEAYRLLKELPEHLRRMVRFALATGLREENICSLEWSRVDLQRRVAWVDAVDTKNDEPHHVPLNQEAVEVIRECLGHHIRWVFTYEGWRWRKIGGKRVRVYERDRVANINTRAWRQALKRAGIENFRVHDLRHTWASWHVQNGTPLPVLQKLGGWKTLSMVMKYAHLGNSHVAEYADNAFRGRVSAEAPSVRLAKDA